MEPPVAAHSSTLKSTTAVVHRETETEGSELKASSALENKDPANRDAVPGPTVIDPFRAKPGGEVHFSNVKPYKLQV
ncbi:uncharacterized [Tachysurus ichikawai]